MLSDFNIAEAVAWYVVFLFSATMHEAAHAWAAKLGGDPTAYYGGQVSIDPTPHIKREPFGMVILPIIGCIFFQWPFGFASAPYDPYWEKMYPKRAALMSLAGPAANLLIAIAAGLLIRIFIFTGHLQMPILESLDITLVAVSTTDSVWDHIALMLSMFFSLNLLLCIFNLLPFPPLDGNGVIQLFLSPTAAEKFNRIMTQPGVRFMGFIVALYAINIIFSVVFITAIMLLYPEFIMGM